MNNTNNNKGFVLSGLGLNRAALAHLLNEFPNKSYQYAIQQLIKEDIKRKEK